MVHLLEKGDRLGLLAFAGSSRQMLELRPLTPKHRRRCLRELQRLTPGEGPADFAALLQAALKTFGSPEASRRVLVILTPARLEAASRPSGGAATRKRLGQKLISSYKRARVAVFPLVFGDSPASPWLRNLAEETGGALLQVEEAALLHQALVSWLVCLKGFQLAPLINGRFLVDQGVEKAVLIAGRGAFGQPVRLLDPLGRQLTPNTKVRQARWLASPAYDMVTLLRPRPGTWTVQGVQKGEGTVVLSTPLALTSEQGDPVTVELRPLPGAPPEGGPKGLRMGTFPPLGSPGRAKLTVTVLTPSFQRERRFDLRVAGAWYQVDGSHRARAKARVIKFRPLVSGLPKNLCGLLRLKPETGGVAARLFRPEPGGAFSMTLLPRGLRPSAISLSLAGILPSS